MTDETVLTQYLEPEPQRVFKRDVMIYSRYERFWHWSQAALIFTLFFSGLGLHGAHGLLSFRMAVTVHSFAAIALIVLWVFATFWNFTTGQWKQYLFKKGIWPVIRFYAWGILKGEPHPYKKSLQRKQNALQSLAYMSFMVIVGPALWSTGIVYLLYDLWSHYSWAGDALTLTAFVHTAAAFVMAAFVIIHVYMTTTGKTVLHYIRTMITGYDKIELSEVEEAYLEQTKMVPMK
ncbi:MAG: cytochrome b/b6 domain-containing protein [Rhodomicrobium sp.]